MIAWIIIIAVLLILLALPVGLDAGYEEAFFIRLKLGPIRRQLLPRGQKKPKKKKEKPKPETAEAEEKPKQKKKLALDDILSMAEIALKTLDRLRMYLSIDLFRLHWTAAAADPYDAVVQFGRVNAALGALRPYAHRALRIREEDLETKLDLEAERPQIAARIILSIQIWEILLLAVCAGASALRWIIRKKRAERAQATGKLGKEHI